VQERRKSRKKNGSKKKGRRRKFGSYEGKEHKRNEPRYEARVTQKDKGRSAESVTK
jgi:hypothetical protein